MKEYDQLDNGNDEESIISESENGTVQMIAPFSVVTEVKSLFTNTCHITVQVALEVLPYFVSTILIGHYYDGNSLDDEYISASGLAATYSTLTGVSLCWGFTTALYTLVPQAVGYGDPSIPYHEQIAVGNALAINLQRSFVTTGIVAVIAIILQCVSGKIMTLLGEPSRIETSITMYAYTLIPEFIFTGVFSACQRICQAIELNSVSTLATLFGALLSLPLMYIFVFHFNWGYIGGGIGISLAVFLMFIFTVLMLYRRKYGFLFNLTSFDLNMLFDKTDYLSYIKLCIPGMLQAMLEFGIVEIAVLLSGHVGKVDTENGVDERTISISGAVIMYDFYLLVAYSLGNGMGSAVNITVGKHIGANNIEHAKQASKWSLIFTFIMCTLMVIILASIRNVVTAIFTHNKYTDDLVSTLILSFSSYAFFYIFARAFSGLYRGLGEQDKTTSFEMFCYYFISVPMILIALFALS